MKKIFLSLILVFSTGTVMAENDLIIMRQTVGGMASDGAPKAAEVIGIDSMHELYLAFQPGVCVLWCDLIFFICVCVC